MTDLGDIANRVTVRAGDDEDVEVVVSRATSTTVRVHGGAVESLSVAESHGIGVRVVSGGREGFAHAGSLDPELVDPLIDQARDNSVHAEPDDRAGLADPDGVAVPVLDRFDPTVGSASVDRKIDMALAVEAAVRAADDRVRGVRTAVYSDSRGERIVTSTRGIELETAATSASLSTNAMIDDADGETRTGAAHEAGRGPGDLDAERIAGLAVERGLRLLGAGRPATGRVTVVLEPRFASTVFGIVGGMLSGERVFKGRTPFAARVGEAVAAPSIDLVEDPTAADSLGASPFDGEGLAARPVALITDGELTGFLHDTRSARGLGVASTASARRGSRSTPSPGHRALRLSPGEGELHDLIAAVDEGIWVQSFQGLHSGVNAVSGDLSVGVEGVRIRGGSLVEPVREGTLAGAVPRLLLDIVAVGSDLEWLPSGNQFPTIVVDGLTLSGTGPTG